MDEQTLNELEMQDEAAGKQVSIEEKRALIREAKRKYGNDYMTFLKRFTGKGGFKWGFDWQALKFNLK
jgi:hypothetical protein